MSIRNLSGMARFTLSGLIALIIHVSSYAQTAKVSLNRTNITLEEALSSISEQTGLGYAITKSQGDSSNPVTIHVENVSPDSALSVVFSNQPFYYSIESNIIKVIEKKNKRPSGAHYAVTGKIINEKGEPVPGATVQVKDSNISTATDELGVFTIKHTAPNDILVVTCIGYEDKKEQLYPGNYAVTIQLEQKAASLDVVSVNSKKGAKHIPKSNNQPATIPMMPPGCLGSTFKINKEDFNRMPSQNIFDRLIKITGELLMNPPNSAELNQSTINIRNRSTIIGNPNPSIVLDGHPLLSDPNNINPNDVESITIIKDAVAAPQWGLQSGNGVIAIITQHGAYNQPLHASATANITIGMKPDLYYLPLISPTDHIEVLKEVFHQGFYDYSLGSPYQLNPAPVDILYKEAMGIISSREAAATLKEISSTDARKEALKYLYQRSLHQQYHLNMRGGGKRYHVDFSTGFDLTKQNLVGNNDTRSTLHLNNAFTFWEKGPEINISVFSSKSVMNNNGIDLKSLPGPYTKLVDDNGRAAVVPKDIRQAFKDSVSAFDLLNWNYRPLEEIRLGNNRLTKSTLVITTGVTYKLLNKIEVNLSDRYENEQFENYNIHGVATYFARNLINQFTIFSAGSVERPIPLGGILDRNVLERTGRNLQAELRFIAINNNKHYLSFLIGADVQHISSHNYKRRTYGITNDNPAGTTIDANSPYPIFYEPASLQHIPQMNDQNDSTDHYNTYYINGQFRTIKKVTFTINLKVTQSNIFGEITNSQAAPLGSMGLSWDLAPKTPNTKLFSLQRLRVSDGVCGNASKTFSTATTLQSAPVNRYGAPTNLITNAANPHLSAEQIMIANVGLDFLLFNNSISGSIDLYNKRGSKLLGYNPGDPTLGLRMVAGNVASMTGHGIEAAFNAKTGNKIWQWQGLLLMSYTCDRVTKFNTDMTSSWYYCDPGYIHPVPDKPLYSIYSLKYSGLDASGDPVGVLNGQPSKNYDSILTSPNANLVYHGPSTPVFYGSFRSSISWKQLELECSIIWKTGYYFRRNSVNYIDPNGLSIGDADMAKRWRQPGDEQVTNIPSLKIDPIRALFFTYSSALIEKGDHIRLQDIRLKYQPKKKKKPEQLEVFVYANNIGLIWKANKKGIDPDYINTIPTPFSLTLGLKANF
jgi:hypothetical protein